MLSTAEKLRREGRAEGERAGERKGKRDTLLLLLRQRFGRLPAAVVARIGKSDAAELDAWVGSVLTAASLDEVLSAKVPRRPRSTRAA
jgi:hypothetical protein